MADYLKKLLPTRIRLNLEAGGNLIKYKAEDVNAMMKQYLLLMRLCKYRNSAVVIVSVCEVRGPEFKSHSPQDFQINLIII